MLILLRSTFEKSCRCLFNDARALQVLKEENFDIVLTITLAGCDVLLAEYLGVAITLFTPVRRMPIFSEDNFGIPIPLSYVPFSIFTSMTDSMSFKERVCNFLLRFIVQPVFTWYLTRPIVAIKREFDIRPELSLHELIGRAELWLSQSSFAIEFAQPSGPIWIPVGGITVKTPSNLPGVSTYPNERANV